ncbi:hypothetical protein [Streptomyces sp. UNOC14_S4]|uniref:hypothetical protein n=1 Tax=Streptomyces sp. UNOC14_S4 TaxID=2872340 RepID=UPI001E4B1FC2|nr:hypothetical protein [Streptomyces sp. UNOC14_S4]MCC3767690.1 hypothetical protein [Streptomyces sp. UNOC14_S4]
MHNLLSAAASASTPLAAGADVISGVTPDWGPFGKMGGTAVTLLGVLAAFALVAGAACFFMGLTKSRGWFGDTQSSLESSRGKGMMIGGLAIVFLVASFGTIFVTVYGMGV